MLRKRKFEIERYITPMLFAALFAINCFITPNFANWYTVRSIITQSTSLMLIAIGATFVISAGYIDISLGSGMAWNSVLFALVLKSTGSVWIAFTVMLLSATVIGLINGINTSYFKIQPMIATMSMMYILRAFSKVLTNGAVVRIRVSWLRDMCYIRFFNGAVPIQALIIAVPLAIGLFLARKTMFGICLESIGDNRQAAYLTGIKVVKNVVAAYILCNILSAIGGVWDSSSVSSADPMSLGILYEMDAIAALVIGGTPISGGRANLVGTVFGVFILKIIDFMISMTNVPEQWSYVVSAAVIVTVVTIQNVKRMRHS